MKRKDLRQYKDEFIRLYKQGYSLRKIGEMYGVTKSSIARYVKEDCELRIRGLTEDQKNRAKELYIQGYNINQISAMLNTSYSSTKKYLSIEFGKVTNSSKKYEELYNDIVKGYKEGLSATQVSEIYNVSRQTVMDYVYESEVEARSYRETSKVYDIDIEYFNSMNKHKSYILGIMLAKARLEIHPQTMFLAISVFKDRKEILDIVCNELYGDESPVYNLIDNNYELRISSLELCNTFNKYGVYSKNNFNKMNLPKGTDLHSFWGGYLFANIKVTNRYIRITSVKQHVDELLLYMKDLGVNIIRFSSTSIVIENKVEVKKIINEYPFIYEIIRAYVSTLPYNSYHAWTSILEE